MGAPYADDMNSETKKRRDIAETVVSVLKAKTDLRASMLVGSVAQGIADKHSDIDLINYYEKLPTQTEFDSAVGETGAVRVGQIGEPGEEGFALRYQLDGVELQTGGQLVAGLERRLERIARGDVDWATAKVAMGVLEAMPLCGEQLIRGWQARARYPDSVRRREVEANLGWFPIWTIDDHLASRDAELFRRQMLLDGAFRVVAVLSALNRLYFSTFQFKRTRAHIAQMAVKPERLAERLDGVANDPPSAAAELLRALVDETKEIVRREMPDVDVDASWQPPRDGR